MFTFLFSCLFRKYFRTGEIVSWILDMQLVHKSILGSTCHNLGCSFWISRRLNLNFKSMAAKKLYDVNFDDRSNFSSTWSCCKKCGYWVCSRKCVLSACWNQFFKTIVHARNGFLKHIPADTPCQIDAFLQTFVN